MSEEEKGMNMRDVGNKAISGNDFYYIRCPQSIIYPTHITIQT